MFENTLWECSCINAWTDKFFIWVIVLYTFYFIAKYLYNRANRNLDLKLATNNHTYKNVGEKE